jgi:hypothetical protein
VLLYTALSTISMFQRVHAVSRSHLVSEIIFLL